MSRVLDLSSPTRQALSLLAVVVAVLACFLGKAFTIDDPVYIAQARHIAEHPFDPYGALVNWYGTAEPLHVVDQNPPLASYYLALAGTLFGWSEIALHAASLVPAVICALATYALARRLTRNALHASAAALFTPAFLVSATNVMCETWMLAFWLLAVVAWLEGIERQRPALLAAAGVFVGLAALSKYPAIALVPLLAVHGFARERKLGAWLAPLAIPIALLTLYELWTRALYGHGLLSGAMAYAHENREGSASDPTAQLAIGLVFLGGTTLHALFAAPLLYRWFASAAGVAVVALLAPGLDVSRYMAATTIDLAPHFPFAARVQFVLFLLGGVSVLALVITDIWTRRTPESLLLSLWVIGMLVFAAGVNWTTNARSILPVVPAVGCLIARRIEDRRTSSAARARWIALAPGIALALAVAWSDHVWSNRVRHAADVLAQRVSKSPGAAYNGAHWGLQHYLEARGLPSFDLVHDRARPGDLFVYANNNTNVHRPPGVALDVVEEIATDEPLWLHTVAPSVGAGFYASQLGPLPFVIGRSAPDTYLVVRAGDPR